MKIYYSPIFVERLHEILNFYDKRNGNSVFSRKILKVIYKQINLLSVMPQIGRSTVFPDVRILFIDSFGIEYQIRGNIILIVNIYSSQTSVETRFFEKK